MTAPRAVEPVVGMEFYFYTEAELHTVTRITSKRVYYVFATDGVMYRGCSSLYYWRASQEYGDVRPVLWTVGPRDKRHVLWTVGPRELPYTRLCHDDERDEYRDVFCMHTPCKCREGCRQHVALWPTRAAALAAGRAFGWAEPVARRVVRK